MAVAQEQNETLVDEAAEVAKEQKEAVRKVADGGQFTAEERDLATEWFLSDEPVDETKTLGITVSPGKEIAWVIRPVDETVLTKIQNASQPRRSSRGRAQQTPVNLGDANARIVVEGTVSPDLDEIVQRKHMAAAADPAYNKVMVLKHRFRNKPGLIDQIAAAILELSGYDEDDVREVEAAKNS